MMSFKSVIFYVIQVVDVITSAYNSYHLSLIKLGQLMLILLKEKYTKIFITDTNPESTKIVCHTISAFSYKAHF